MGLDEIMARTARRKAEGLIPSYRPQVGGKPDAASPRVSVPRVSIAELAARKRH